MNASLVLVGVTIVDVEAGKLVPDQRVVIGGSRIRAVGSSSSVNVPNNVQVVDARGQYLMPGLWDMHTHAGRATSLIYPLFLANGITGIRDAGSPVPLDTLIQWRQQIVAGRRVGPPRQLLSGQSITNYLKDCDRSRRWGHTQTCVADSADAVHYVDSLKAVGADMIKPRDVRPAMYFVIAAEARRVGIAFGGHTWDNIAIEASDSGASLIDHLHPSSGDYPGGSGVAAGLRKRCWAGDWLPRRKVVSAEACRPVAEQFTRNNTWVIPTLIASKVPGYQKTVTKTAKAQVILARLAARTAEFWSGSLLQGNWLHGSTTSDASHASAADSLGVLRVMQASGMPIIAGTDAASGFLNTVPPGFSLHAELALYVAEGLTPLNALQSATINPAKMWSATDSLGSIAPGKLADLVLLDADPLADITNTTTIRAVVANGRYFDRIALDSLLAEAQTRAMKGP